MIKPCPFCGKAPDVVYEDVEPQGDAWYGATMATFIRCECGCCLFDGRFHEGFETWDREKQSDAEKAIEAWNKRI